MKNFSFSFLLITICLFFASCSGNKNYKVEVRGSGVYVTMHCPSIGVVGINKVSYDGFTYEEVEKEIFDEIRSESFDGDYTVWVTMQFKDEYGNYSDGPAVPVTTLNGAEVKKYASYSYFNGKSDIYKAFPWVHNYR